MPHSKQHKHVHIEPILGVYVQLWVEKVYI